MFRGLYEHTLDAKGRISLPSHLREVLLSQGDEAGERLIITTGIDLSNGMVMALSGDMSERALEVYKRRALPC